MKKVGDAQNDYEKTINLKIIKNFKTKSRYLLSSLIESK
jgi:hypothetical protein